MLTVEIRDANLVESGSAEVQIFCDTEGLSVLIEQLRRLSSGSTHVHFMTPAWAGSELGEKPLGEDTDLIHHFRVTVVPDQTS